MGEVYCLHSLLPLLFSPTVFSHSFLPLRQLQCPGVPTPRGRDKKLKRTDMQDLRAYHPLGPVLDQRDEAQGKNHKSHDRQVARIDNTRYTRKCSKSSGKFT